MGKPYEIIASPFEVYIAAVGSTYPDVDTTPASPWVKLGTSGNKNISEDGVVVSHPQTIELFRMLGSTGPVKAARTEEDLLISLTLHDLTLEHYRRVLNDGTVTDVAAVSGTPGYRHVPLRRGLTVNELALLVKGASPYDENMYMQFEVPRVIVTSEPEVTFVKGEPAGLEIEFTALEDPDAASDSLRFGRLVAQDADALP